MLVHLGTETSHSQIRICGVTINNGQADPGIFNFEEGDTEDGVPENVCKSSAKKGVQRRETVQRASYEYECALEGPTDTFMQGILAMKVGRRAGGAASSSAMHCHPKVHCSGTGFAR